MPYNQEIESRIKKVISAWPGITEKKMFGGVGFMMNGNMICGVHKDYLILRLSKNKADEAMGLPFSKPFDITGRPMKGWIMAKGDGFRNDEEFEYWLDYAREFVLTLPPK